MCSSIHRSQAYSICSTISSVNLCERRKSEKAIALANRETHHRTHGPHSRTRQHNLLPLMHRTEDSQTLKDLQSNAICSGSDGLVNAWPPSATIDSMERSGIKKNDRTNLQSSNRRSTSALVWKRSQYGLLKRPFVDSIAEGIKFTRFRSNRIPTPAGLHLWHIDLVDRADFFGFTPDCCLEMPDRDCVPNYTTVRLVNRVIDVERLEALIQISPVVLQPVSSENQQPLDEGVVQLAKELARTWMPNPKHDWSTIQSVVERLRNEYQFKLLTAPDTNLDTNSSRSQASSKREPEMMYSSQPPPQLCSANSVSEPDS